MKSVNIDDDSISAKNAVYWQELCGTYWATQMGVTDSSSESLKKFDDWYFRFYPYLKSHLEPALLTNGKVLEIGLGYGTVASYLMERGTNYHGLDIATGPVSMANLRAVQQGFIGNRAVEGNALDMSQFADGAFNAVVAIGALHHTGDFRRAIREVARITSRGGTIVGMVYSAFSLRNWLLSPRLMLKTLLNNRGITGAVIAADEYMRWLSDHNQNGSAAPATEYFSRRALRAILSEYGSVTIRCRNLDTVSILGVGGNFIRWILIRTPLARVGGLDLYFELVRTP